MSENEVADEPQEPIEQILDQPEMQNLEDYEPKEKEPTMVPLSVAQKLREKKRELELELQWERQRNTQVSQPKPAEDDNSRYESATKEDLRSSQEEAVRIVEEKLWIKQNREKYDHVIENLPQFLKQRPNLASAINMSTNRYEEAFTLMSALSPKQQKEMITKPKRPEAPNGPNSIPKAAAMNDAIDVMNMNDSEFAAWRQSQRKRR